METAKGFARLHAQHPQQLFEVKPEASRQVPIPLAYAPGSAGAGDAARQRPVEGDAVQRAGAAYSRERHFSICMQARSRGHRGHEPGRRG